MMPGSPSPQKPACAICARRKVKCDKGDPCSNCLKGQTKCVYEAPALHRQQRKRAADEELLARLAVYEDLMRKNNVDFSPYAHTWVCSKQKPRPGVDELQSFKASSTSPFANISVASISKYVEANHVKNLWSSLSSELKHPPVQGLCRKDDPLLHPMPPISAIISPAGTEASKMHPEPRHIYRLWQIFVEDVNPLLKIIHVPTLQQRILDASWDPASAPKSLTAIMFAIYTLAVTSSSPEVCQSSFGETRGALLTRYRTATLRALVEADFFTTRDLEVVQALVLFLFANPEADLTTTLTSTAIKLMVKMGIHQSKSDPRASFFEREMSIRLWWQLYGLEARTRAIANVDKRVPPSRAEFGNVRSPLNINDADLHPDMTEPPVEHAGPTEMMCILMKYEAFKWIRSSPAAARVFESIFQSRTRDAAMVEVENRAIDEIEAIYYDKYLRHADRRIPLHSQTYTISKLVVTRMRFKVLHPRGRVPADGGDVCLTLEQADELFELALGWAELVEAGIGSRFSSHLFTHMTSKCHIDAYVYLISDLRRRTVGERVSEAWKVVERFYDAHPDIIEDASNSFFVALGELTLEAWEAFWGAEHARGLRSPGVDGVPQFIRLLWTASGKRNTSVLGNDGPGHDSLGGLGLTPDGNLDWEYWNNFLTF